MSPTMMSNDSIAIINNGGRIKFIYNYGGRIAYRSTDSKLLYIGGFTRVLAVSRAIKFDELTIKFRELCGSPMSLKCKLPTEDLDVLVSITCDDDLVDVIREYDRLSPAATHKDMKITVVLVPIKSRKNISPASTVEDLGTSGDASSSRTSTTSPPEYANAGFRSARPPQIPAYPRRHKCQKSLPDSGVFSGVRNHHAGYNIHYHACCGQRCRRDVVPIDVSNIHYAGKASHHACCHQGRRRTVFGSAIGNVHDQRSQTYCPCNCNLYYHRSCCEEPKKEGRKPKTCPYSKSVLFSCFNSLVCN